MQLELNMILTPKAELHEIIPQITVHAFDLDDTSLNPNGQLPTQTARVWRELYEQGYTIVIQTGRPWLRVRPIIEDHALSEIVHAAICSNGVKIICPERHTYRRRLVLPREATAAVVDYARSFDLCLMTIGYDPQDPMRKIRKAERNLESLGLDFLRFIDLAPPPLVDDLLTTPENPSRILLFPHESQSLRHIEALRAAYPHLIDHPMPHYSPLHCFEVLPVGATKRDALGQLLHELGYSHSQVAAYGDSHNDREALECAGLPVVAIGRKTPNEIRRLARLTFPYNDGRGLPNFLREFFL